MIKIFSFTFLVVFFLTHVPVVVLAQTYNPPGFPYWGTNPPLLPCGTNQPGSSGPCTNFCQLLVLFQRLIYFGITLVLAAIAPVLIAWGGVMLLTSGGSVERMSGGKKIITGTIVGIALALGSFIIVNTFFWVMGITFGSSQTTWQAVAC